VKVIWTSQDRIDIWDYIATDNPHAAARMDELFSDSANQLTEHPKLGRPGQVPDTACWSPTRINDW